MGLSVHVAIWIYAAYSKYSVSVLSSKFKEKYFWFQIHFLKKFVLIIVILSKNISVY